MELAKTVLLFILVAISMIIIIPLGLIIFILSAVGLRKLMNRVVYAIAQGWALVLIRTTGCRPRVTGREHIPKKGGVCLVSNHGSIFDILLLLAYVGRPFGFIAKKELAWIPFLNIWILLLGGLFIDRGSLRKAAKTISRGIQHIKAGGGMIIFPEGHRSKGRGLLPFHSGSFKLAAQPEAPVIPVAISGSYDVFERHYRVKRVSVRIAFEKPVLASEIPLERRRQRLADLVYGIIQQTLREQAAENGEPVPENQ
ncbi:MAG: 1-acyl-sn-glycerol-3-phosphate acyltransferase [Treponema sp.]|jgi:1-acyl-sn-glycerol-3-phosphate acyltransferase|nr:1-acyl-sn-glycerol-3-phosphate acyltransferase [Treponema sp.]